MTKKLNPNSSHVFGSLPTQFLKSAYQPLYCRIGSEKFSHDPLILLHFLVHHFTSGEKYLLVKTINSVLGRQKCENISPKNEPPGKCGNLLMQLLSVSLFEPFLLPRLCKGFRRLLFSFSIFSRTLVKSQNLTSMSNE